MSMKDRVSHMTPLLVTSANIVDRRGYNSLTFLISLSGAGAGNIAMTHGDAFDGADQTAVAAADIVGNAASLAMSTGAAGDMRMAGYVGAKRYVKCNPGANATMVALLTDPALGPTPNPPVKYAAPTGTMALRDLTGPQVDITAVTKAAPAVVTASGHTAKVDDSVGITGTGFASIDNQVFKVEAVSADTVTLAGSDTSAEAGTMTPGGKLVQAAPAAAPAAEPAPA